MRLLLFCPFGACVSKAKVSCGAYSDTRNSKSNAAANARQVGVKKVT